MKTHPKTIWLQYHGDQRPEAGEVVSVRDVTWSEHKEFAWDVGPYVLRSELERENARLRNALEVLRDRREWISATDVDAFIRNALSPNFNATQHE